MYKIFEYWENIIKKYKINLIVSYGAGWDFTQAIIYNS